MTELITEFSWISHIEYNVSKSIKSELVIKIIVTQLYCIKICILIAEIADEFLYFVLIPTDNMAV